MRFKKTLLLISLGLTLSACSPRTPKVEPNHQPSEQPAVSSQSPTATETNEEFTASFAIFTNGTFRVFTAAMYHNQSTNVYIESSNPNIIQVKKTGVTWGDFFATLPFKVTDTCLTTGTGQTFCTNETRTLKFFIDGELAADALNREISSGDKLLISYGIDLPTDQSIQKQLQRIPEPK